MDNKTSSVDYEILGYKIKLREDDQNTQVSPSEVVDLVRSEIDKISQRAPHLDRGEIALLAALQLAQEKLTLEHHYQTELNELKDKAGQALNLIEEVTPSTM